MKRICCVLGLGLCLTWLAEPAHADGWPQKKGQGYYRVGFNWVRAGQFYEVNGNRIDIPTLSDYTVSFYGEYGINDRITGIVYVPFMQRITLNKQVGEPSGVVFFEGDAITGVADIDVGLRIGLLKAGNTVLSAGLLLGLPVGNTDQANGLFTGDGEFNQRIALELGHSFYPAPAYVVASAGFNNRTQGFSDELHYKLEAGYSFSEKWTAITRIRGVSSFENGDEGITGGTGGLYGNNQRYLAYGAELAYAFTSALGFSLTLEGATLGRNVLSAPAVNVGIFLKR